MEYYRVSNEKSKKHPLLYKYHIKGSENTFLCGLGMRNTHVLVTDDFMHELVCENCKNIVDGVPYLKNKSFRAMMVQKLTDSIDFTSKDFKAELSKACLLLIEEYGELGFSCDFTVDREFSSTITGKVFFHTNKYKNMYMMFTYKPFNKIKLRFEKSLRDYLTLSFQTVVGE